MSQRWLMICIGLLLIGCGEQTQTATPRIAFEIYRTVEQSAQARPIDADGTTMYIEQSPIITQNEIASAYRTQDHVGRPALSLEFTPDGAATLERVSETEAGKPLVVLVEGAFWTAPIVQGTLSSQIILVAPDFSEGELRRIAAGLNR